MHCKPAAGTSSGYHASSNCDFAKGRRCVLASHIPARSASLPATSLPGVGPVMQLHPARQPSTQGMPEQTQAGALSGGAHAPVDGAAASMESPQPVAPGMPSSSGQHKPPTPTVAEPQCQAALEPVRGAFASMESPQPQLFWLLASMT